VPSPYRHSSRRRWSVSGSRASCDVEFANWGGIPTRRSTSLRMSIRLVTGPTLNELALDTDADTLGHPSRDLVEPSFAVFWRLLKEQVDACLGVVGETNVHRGVSEPAALGSACRCEACVLHDQSPEGGWTPNIYEGQDPTKAEAWPRLANPIWHFGRVDFLCSWILWTPAQIRPLALATWRQEVSAPATALRGACMTC
jgi:hypothetical protein